MATEAPLAPVNGGACVSPCLLDSAKELVYPIGPSCSGLHGVLTLRGWKPRSIKSKHQPSAFFPILLAFYSSQRAAAPGCCKSIL